MTKVAILIDGGFFLKRLPTVRKDADTHDPASVDRALGQLISSHLDGIHSQNDGKTPWALLYRCFYYDAAPYTNKGHLAISKKAIDYSKTPEAVFRLELFQQLRKRPNLAIRLGHIERERSWIIKEEIQKQLLSGTKSVEELTDDDFYPGLRQKAVDMRLGLDVASITLKKQADTLVLVTGDADFVPAAKLARREGVPVILDPLWQSVKPQLFEHIDGLRSGFSRPRNNSVPGPGNE
jgi:uncharacterized LabA/DUF88 family protein